MLFNLNNLGGILFYKDIPFLKFKYLNDKLVIFQLMEIDGVSLPCEFDSGVFTDERLRKFLHRRLISVDEKQLKTTPVKVYDNERLIRYSEAKNSNDCYWLMCDNDNTCWEAVKDL